MELSLLPADWENITISEFCGDEQLIVDGPFGSNLKNEHYVASGIPVLSGGNISGNIWKFENIRFISESKAQELIRCNARVGDLLTVKIGSVGFSAQILDLDEYEFAIIPANLLRIRVNRNDSDPTYLKFFLQYEKTVKTLQELGTSTAQPALNLRKFRKLQISRPPHEEQKVIAEALSDIDELISITKNAISKTENTKQSILYPLLTGKNSKSNVANWQQQTLGEILEYEQPTKYLVNTNKHKDSGKYPVLTAGKTFILGYTDDEYGVYAKEEVILFDDFTTEKKYVDFPFKVKSSACKMLTSRTDAINLRFVFEAMKLLKFQPYDHKRYWISEYSKLVLPLPEKNEQDSIAEVIKDFDLKLSLLKSELEKYEWLKQGMMHELLSGNVRLV